MVVMSAPLASSLPPPAPFRTSSIRRDLRDMVALLRFVKQRRLALSAAGESTAAADELLATLKQELRLLWRVRATACTLEQYQFDPDIRHHLDPGRAVPPGA
jgi:hypothetical protein